MRKRCATIGVDIGGTKSLYALLDQRWTIVAEEKFRTHEGRNARAAFARNQARAVRTLLAEARRCGLALEAVGVGMAGRIDMAEGVARKAPNLEFLEGYSFPKHLGALAGVPVLVVNDVAAALYGELKLGAARRARHVIGVWLGTGVGGALAIDGRLHLGATGAAGDLGNYLLYPVEREHEVARIEILDGVASRVAIAGEAAALAEKRWAPHLRRIAGANVRDITSRNLARSIRAGDREVENLVRSRARLLGAVLSNFVDFLDPEMIVLGGGLVMAMPKLLRSEIRDAVRARGATRVRVANAKLGDHAVTVGAARLALDIRSGDASIEGG